MVLSLAACAIENDIPYPIVEGAVTAFEVEGQCASQVGGSAAAKIDRTNRLITLSVNDLVNLSALKITRFEVSNDALIEVDPNVCMSPENFPTNGFVGVGDGQNTQVNFTDTVKFTLKTYQDYLWRVKVSQVVDRNIQVENQVGNPVIDPINKTAIIYVSKKQSLRTVKVNVFQLAGEHGTVIPDPTQSTTYDFSKDLYTTFMVKHGWETTASSWKVFVYQTDETVALTSNVFPRTVSATVYGSMQNGSTPIVEYKASSESSWRRATLVSTSTTSYEAELDGLSAATVYQYRVTVGEEQTEEKSFSTTSKLQLENAGFEDWHQVEKLWNPWPSSGTSYWDTGNRGATTVGDSNVTSSTDTSTGSGLSAMLQSKYIVIKFAAGSIFTGSYLATDGTNGILGFGRDFTAFPKRLTFEYKYTSSIVNRNHKDFPQFSHLIGKPDSCQVYIALADWEPEEYKGQKYPYIIRTRPGETQHLFNVNDSHIIAYAQMTKGDNVTSWTKATLELEYRYTDRAPKYILVVAASSKYGDYFTGGDSSKLMLDNFNLEY